MEQTIKAKKGAARPGGGKRKNRTLRKEARRAAALLRQAAYDAMTDEQKIAYHTERGYPNCREVVRLGDAA